MRMDASGMQLLRSTHPARQKCAEHTFVFMCDPARLF